MTLKKQEALAIVNAGCVGGMSDCIQIQYTGELYPENLRAVVVTR